MIVKRIGWMAASLAVGGLFVLFWKYASDARLISPVILPAPDRVWSSLFHGLSSGDLTWQLVRTVERMLYGWLLASLVGIALGASISVSVSARAYFGPMLEFLRPLPASAIIPVAIALLGLSDAMVLSVIAFGALWPMLLSTIHGFQAVEPRLYEVGQLLRMSKLELTWKIALPSAMPDILSGMRLGLTISLVLAVVGEMLASRDGLGQWILLSARSFRAPDLWAGVVLLGAIGYLSAIVLSAVESRMLRWLLR
jgi:sulfonate transport system permease protein